MGDWGGRFPCPVGSRPQQPDGRSPGIQNVSFMINDYIIQCCQIIFYFGNFDRMIGFFVFLLLLMGILESFLKLGPT